MCFKRDLGATGGERMGTGREGLVSGKSGGDGLGQALMGFG